MALTPAEIDALPDYTASQMVKLWRHVIAELGSNPESTVSGPNGRAYTMRQLDEAQRMLTFWLGRQAAEDDATSGAGMFEYGDLASGV
jgi:hypothetical protein